MATSIVDPETLLAVDIGSVHTRAVLFDVVEGRYEVVALGVALTTAQAPWNDVREGVVQAVEQVQRITGRALLGGGGELLTGSQVDGEGVDRVVITLSAGRPLQVICVGALQSISLDSVRRLAESTYAELVRLFHLNDRLTPEERLNEMVLSRPDLIVLAGGTDGGAVQSVLSLVENVGLVAYLAPTQHKPLVFYAGNQALVSKVRELLEPLTGLVVAPNVRPTLDTERLLVGHHELVEAFRLLRRGQMRGLDDLMEVAQGHLWPTATAFGRMVRYLSRLYGGEKGVLGVDVGASATTLAAAWQGQRMTLKVYPSLGLGERLDSLLRHTPLQSITRWLTIDLDDDDVVDYLYTKATYPESVPMTEEELQVEQALGRQLLRLAVRRAYADFPQAFWQPQRALPLFEPVMLSGSLFTRAPHPAQTVLLALDGLQPIGVTTLVLDQNHLLPMLGAAAEVNPYLSVQVLESPHFLPLATVVAPVWRGGFGRPVLRVQVETGEGKPRQVELKGGTLEVIPIPLGTQARVTLRPASGVDVGRGPGRGYTFQVAGTHLGLVLDGRGRPLRLPADRERRHQLYRLWWSKIRD